MSSAHLPSIFLHIFSATHRQTLQYTTTLPLSVRYTESQFRRWKANLHSYFLAYYLHKISSHLFSTSFKLKSRLLYVRGKSTDGACLSDRYN